MAASPLIDPTRPQFRQVKLEDGYMLQCPSCGGANLHQCAYDIYHCNLEEDAAYTHVSVDGSKRPPNISTEHDSLGTSKDYGSGRRDQFVMRFWCEECSGCEEASPEPKLFLSLTISQHKGLTYMCWDMS